MITLPCIWQTELLWASEITKYHYICCTGLKSEGKKFLRMEGTETGSGTGTRRDAEGTGSFERMVGMAPAFASAVDA